jgi:hypothetical protein
MMRSICQCNPGLLYKSLKWGVQRRARFAHPLLPWDSGFFHGMPGNLWRGNTVAALVNQSLSNPHAIAEVLFRKLHMFDRHLPLALLRRNFPGKLLKIVNLQFCICALPQFVITVKSQFRPIENFTVKI